MKIIIFVILSLFTGCLADTTCPIVDPDDAYEYIKNKYPDAQIIDYKRHNTDDLGVKFSVNGTVKKLYLEDCGNVYKYNSGFGFDEWNPEDIDNWHIINYNKSLMFWGEKW